MDPFMQAAIDRQAKTVRVQELHMGRQ